MNVKFGEHGSSAMPHWFSWRACLQVQSGSGKALPSRAALFKLQGVLQRGKEAELL